MLVQPDLLSIVAALQDAANRHAVDEVMAMFADDAVFELTGLTRLVGKNEIRSIFEYDAGVDGNIQFVDCTSTGDTVTCRLLETNERIRLAGLDSLLYPACRLSFDNGLIRLWSAVPDPESTRAIMEFWGAVGEWIKEHYPAEYTRMFTREGRFIRSRENGERAVRLGRQYRSTVTT
jgi:hypothetical protein